MLLRNRRKGDAAAAWAACIDAVSSRCRFTSRDEKSVWWTRTVRTMLRQGGLCMSQTRDTPGLWAQLCFSSLGAVIGASHRVCTGPRLGSQWLHIPLYPSVPNSCGAPLLDGSAAGAQGCRPSPASLTRFCSRTASGGVCLLSQGCLLLTRRSPSVSVAAFRR